MGDIDFKKEFEFYKSKYSKEDSSLVNLLENKDLNDVLNDRERVRKKELIKFERLEIAYREKIENLEMNLIRVNNELKENRKDLKKILNSIVEVLDEVDEFKDILKEREDRKNLKTFNRTIKAINKKINYMGLEQIKTVLEQFNEDMHYCVEVVEDSDYENETIIEEIKSGYKYKGKVIRESRVVVIKNEGE